MYFSLLNYNRVAAFNPYVQQQHLTAVYNNLLLLFLNVLCCHCTFIFVCLCVCTLESVSFLSLHVIKSVRTPLLFAPRVYGNAAVINVLTTTLTVNTKLFNRCCAKSSHCSQTQEHRKHYISNRSRL